MNKFFVHIPKTGGTSLKIYCERNEIHDIFFNHPKDDHQNLNVEEAIEGLNKIGRLGPVFAHLRYRDYVEEVRKKYQAFCIVRNPWALEVSKYKQLMNTSKERGVFELFRKKTNMTFTEFLKFKDSFGKSDYLWLHSIPSSHSQLTYIKSNEGENNCDVLRYEMYQKECKLYLNHNINLKERVSRNKTDYRKLYKKRDIQKVADWYKDDIDHFGFDFDSFATRNTYYTG